MSVDMKILYMWFILHLHIDAIATDDKFSPVNRKKTFTTPV